MFSRIKQGKQREVHRNLMRMSREMLVQMALIIRPHADEHQLFIAPKSQLAQFIIDKTEIGASNEHRREAGEHRQHE